MFISCIGSRDDEHGYAYCSKVCCMYNAKHALLLKEKLHDAQTYVFYMDIRANGKGYEEFVRRAIEKYGAIYIRGRVSRIFQHGDKLIVRGVDTLPGSRSRSRRTWWSSRPAMEPSRTRRTWRASSGSRPTSTTGSVRRTRSSSRSRC